MHTCLKRNPNNGRSTAKFEEIKFVRHFTVSMKISKKYKNNLEYRLPEITQTLLLASELNCKNMVLVKTFIGKFQEDYG